MSGRGLISLPDDGLTGTEVTVSNNKGNNKIRVLYTNADQFLNKQNLLIVQIAGNIPLILLSSAKYFLMPQMLLLIFH